MKRCKKYVASLALLTMLSASLALTAHEPRYEGCGYECARSTPSISPFVAVGVVAIATAVVLVLKNRSHHGHN